MKKYLLVLLAIVVLAGCDSQQTSKYQGITSQQDFIAEGMAHLKNSEIPQAIQSFDAAIRQNPKDVSNYLVLAQVYMRLKNFPGAVDTLRAAVRIDTSSADAHYLLGLALQLNGNATQEAVAAVQKSVDLYIQTKDEENFRKSVILLKQLTEGPGQAAAEGVKDAS